MNKPNDTKSWFEAVVDLLITHGNTLAYEQKWSWDKEGGHCYLTRPIDFEMIKSNFEIPQDVILYEKYQNISTVQEYLTINQRVPSQAVRFIAPPENPDLRLPNWRPIVLKKSGQHDKFPVVAFEKELRKLGAESVGQYLKLDGYVEPYKSDYLNHTWLIRKDAERIIGIFIQGPEAGISTFMQRNGDADITELISVFKPLAEKLDLMIYNDQYREEVLA